MKPIIKHLLSGVLSAAMAFSAIPIVPAHADESTKSYPYMLFAASDAEGAILSIVEIFVQMAILRLTAL